MDTVPYVRAVVLGAAGQLGSDLSQLIGPGSGVTREQVSVSDPDAIDAVLSLLQPAIVFNCAAYNAVDRAETERELAYAVNADGPANVAQGCARHRIRLVHFSPNFVFDGGLDRPHLESDAPAPIVASGAPKPEAEQRMLDP